MIAWLKVTTWKGSTCWWASHYYGTLVFRKGDNREEHQVQYGISEALALEMNKQDREAGDRISPWRPGDMTSRFDDQEHLRAVAKQVYKELFPEATALLEGWFGDYDPRLVLDGPQDLIEQGNAIVAQAEAIDWWEKDEAAMKVLSKRWDALLKSLGLRA